MQTQRAADDAGQANQALVSKKVKKVKAISFEYSGGKKHVIEDRRACADLFRALGGSSHPLPPPEEMEEEDGYQNVAQYLVKVF